MRKMLGGAAAFDGVGAVFCLTAAREVAGWLSIPRTSVYVTGAIFLVAAAAGALTLPREPLRVGWIVIANEVFALWCLLVLAVDDPNVLGLVLLCVAVLSSAGTGVAELRLAGRRTA